MSLLSDAEQIFRAALRAADAGQAIHRAFRSGLLVPWQSFSRVFLVAVGKAALPMARSVHHELGPKLTGGIIIAPHSHAGQACPLPLRTARHPVPDDSGHAAALEVEALAQGLASRDLLLVAISGGASALLPAPATGLTLEAKQDLTRRLLLAGADIHQLNTVRKHLSRLKGGRLATLAQPAAVLGLLLSDVIGDAPEVIGSGLTAPDPTSVTEAAVLLQRFGCPEFVPLLSETPKSLPNTRNQIVGSNRQSLHAASTAARRLGYHTVTLTSGLEGEAREVAKVQAALLRDLPVRRPACLLSGGETTVTVRGSGRGGRNQELALALGIALRGQPEVLALSLGTDGVDGPTDAAGAWVDGETCFDRVSAESALANNDSFAYLDKSGNLIRTGPTGTNVMDIQVLLAGPAPER